MSLTFADFLRARAERSYRKLLSELKGVTANQAFQFRVPNWPDHRWGIGQDGSIAGIVYHVAAWKQMTLPLFDAAGKPQTREEFDVSAAPHRSDWVGIVDWLHKAGDEWNARLDLLTDEEFDSTRDWEGAMLPISSFVVEMMEHDIQHASQIAYIKQRLASE